MARHEEAVFLLPPSLRDRLAATATTHRVSRSLIVRELLEAYLSTWEDDHYDRVGAPTGSDRLVRDE